MRPTVETHSTSDESRRFLFENADIRGEIVSLDASFKDILAIHQYAPGVTRLLGEFLAAAVLLSSNLKFEGKLVLQARSDGQVPLLMVECNHELQVRGIARGVEQATSGSNEALLRNGQLTITVDPLKGQRYQGIIALQTGTLADNLGAYFNQSEQLRSRIWLAADGQRAAGLLLQQLPRQITEDINLRCEQWESASTSTDAVSAPILLSLPGAALLRRLYPRDPVRLFDSTRVQFHCSCSRQRCQNALSCLDPSEANQLLKEQGCITVDCEFCNAQYRFLRNDLSSVFGWNTTKTLH
ncbi:MAG: Hsp33 family molecular chaperone HslO [Halioglobus sp.]|nr:Hsp33 family molecular chaperone HslO [Halioglobus sp.]